jgi:hypothetical protein
MDWAAFYAILKQTHLVTLAAVTNPPFAEITGYAQRQIELRNRQNDLLSNFYSIPVQQTFRKN